MIVLISLYWRAASQHNSNAQPESSHLSRLDTTALLCAQRCWIGSRKGYHQEDSRGTRPPNACGPIKRLARNDGRQTLADTWARRSEKGGMWSPTEKVFTWCNNGDLGHQNEADMKEKITIRMTKTRHQDPSPHYSTQDSKLIRHTIAGLIGFVSDDLT
jgi:hypothetical protein